MLAISFIGSGTVYASGTVVVRRKKMAQQIQQPFVQPQVGQSQTGQSHGGASVGSTPQHAASAQLPHPSTAAEPWVTIQTVAVAANAAERTASALRARGSHLVEPARQLRDFAAIGRVVARLLVRGSASSSVVAAVYVDAGQQAAGSLDWVPDATAVRTAASIRESIAAVTPLLGAVGHQTSGGAGIQQVGQGAAMVASQLQTQRPGRLPSGIAPGPLIGGPDPPDAPLGPALTATLEKLIRFADGLDWRAEWRLAADDSVGVKDALQSVRAVLGLARYLIGVVDTDADDLRNVVSAFVESAEQVFERVQSLKQWPLAQPLADLLENAVRAGRARLGPHVR